MVELKFEKNNGTIKFYENNDLIANNMNYLKIDVIDSKKKNWEFSIEYLIIMNKKIKKKSIGVFTTTEKKLLLPKEIFNVVFDYLNHFKKVKMFNFNSNENILICKKKFIKNLNLTINFFFKEKLNFHINLSQLISKEYSEKSKEIIFDIGKSKDDKIYFGISLLKNFHLVLSLEKNNQEIFLLENKGILENQVKKKNFLPPLLLVFCIIIFSFCIGTFAYKIINNKIEKNLMIVKNEEEENMNKAKNKTMKEIFDDSFRNENDYNLN